MLMLKGRAIKKRQSIEISKECKIYLISLIKYFTIYNDSLIMEVQSTRSYNFGQAFLNELIDFGMSGFSNLPYSTIFVMIVFLLDTTMRSSTAKLYFVCGYFIELLLFYSFARICFPSETDQKLNPVHYLNYMATPLQRYTHASFFNFSAGYVLGYWGNLNILLNNLNISGNFTEFY